MLDRELLFQEFWEHTSQPRKENTVSPVIPQEDTSARPAAQCTGRRGDTPEPGESMSSCTPSPTLPEPQMLSILTANIIVGLCQRSLSGQRSLSWIMTFSLGWEPSLYQVLVKGDCWLRMRKPKHREGQ